LTNIYCIVMMYFQHGVAVEMSFSGCANLGFYHKTNMPYWHSILLYISPECRR
jgi:hypothetical protein